APPAGGDGDRHRPVDQQRPRRGLRAPPPRRHLPPHPQVPHRAPGPGLAVEALPLRPPSPPPDPRPPPPLLRRPLRLRLPAGDVDVAPLPLSLRPGLRLHVPAIRLPRPGPRRPGGRGGGAVPPAPGVGARARPALQPYFVVP